jgi:hypothetical protein
MLTIKQGEQRMTVIEEERLKKKSTETQYMTEYIQELLRFDSEFNSLEQRPDKFTATIIVDGDKVNFSWMIDNGYKEIK